LVESLGPTADLQVMSPGLNYVYTISAEAGIESNPFKRVE
jgi:hypothetical protein